MAVLQGGGQNLPPPPNVCVIQKTPCGIGLINLHKVRNNLENSGHLSCSHVFKSGQNNDKHSALSPLALIIA